MRKCYLYVESLALVEVWIRVIDRLKVVERVHGERVAGGDAVLNRVSPLLPFASSQKLNHEPSLAPPNLTRFQVFSAIFARKSTCQLAISIMCEIGLWEEIGNRPDSDGHFKGGETMPSLQKTAMLSSKSPLILRPAVQEKLSIAP